MLELTSFPYLPSGNPNQAISALLTLCREMSPDGEQFRLFRRRMKALRLYEQERYEGTIEFLGIKSAGHIKPSAFTQSIKRQKTDSKARALLADRLWDVNPLLFKSVLDLLKQNVHSRDDVIKHVNSFAYRGNVPPRPHLESWLHLALGLGILKMVGIALDIGDNCERFIERASELDVEEFLEDAAAASEESAAAEQASAAEEAEDGAASSDGDSAAQAATATAAPPVAPPPQPRVSSGSSDGLFIDASQFSSPRGAERPGHSGRFAGQAVFADDVLEETTQRIQAWWSGQSAQPVGAIADDFGLGADAWMEGPEEALYRSAVAAALVFRLGRDRDAVQAAFEGLDKAGVLTDLYYGTAPEELPDNVDSKALMLASLVARRCAESPELAATLDKQASAAKAFEILDGALGRGFLRVELFWLMRALSDMGALRFQDLQGFTATPRRLVRDTLFRLGYIVTPYAHDAAHLIPAAHAARRATGAVEPADEVLMSFALAAGCAYDCAHRRKCEYACRERAES